MKLEHSVAFELPVAMPQPAAIAFVRDVPGSLAHADFLQSLLVDGDTIRATLPVNAALFGQRLLPFVSQLRETEQGARLIGLHIEPSGPGWARVAGEAAVEPNPAGGSTLRYRFDIEVHIELPEAERWGGRALLRMIEYTAKTVLERVTAAFPRAIAEAAEAAMAATHDEAGVARDASYAGRTAALTSGKTPHPLGH